MHGSNIQLQVRPKLLNIGFLPDVSLVDYRGSTGGFPYIWSVCVEFANKLSSSQFMPCLIILPLNPRQSLTW